MLTQRDTGANTELFLLGDTRNVLGSLPVHLLVSVLQVTRSAAHCSRTSYFAAQENDCLGLPISLTLSISPPPFRDCKKIITFEDGKR